MGGEHAQLLGSPGVCSPKHAPLPATACVPLAPLDEVPNSLLISYRGAPCSWWTMAFSLASLPMSSMEGPSSLQPPSPCCTSAQATDPWCHLPSRSQGDGAGRGPLSP